MINHLVNAASVWMSLTDYKIKIVHMNPNDYHQIIITRSSNQVDRSLQLGEKLPSQVMLWPPFLLLMLMITIDR